MKIKGLKMKSLVESVIGLCLVFSIVALFAWGQTEEMCKTEKNKTAAELQACKDHNGIK